MGYVAEWLPEMSKLSENLNSYGLIEWNSLLASSSWLIKGRRCLYK